MVNARFSHHRLLTCSVVLSLFFHFPWKNTENHSTGQGVCGPYTKTSFPLLSLYWFPTAAVSNDSKLDDLKQYSFINLQFWGQRPKCVSLG